MQLFVTSLAALLCLALVAMVPAESRAARRGDVGRIWRTTPLDDGAARVFVTFQTRGGIPIAADELDFVDVSTVSSGGFRKRVERFDQGVSTEDGASVLATLSDSQVPLDVVVVVSAGDNPERSPDAEALTRDAAILMLRRLPKTARVNLLWVNDQVSTYVAHPDKEGELSPWWRYREDWCRSQDGSFYDAIAENGDVTGIHPCGLHEERSGLARAISASSGSATFEGFYPLLLGLPWTFCTDTPAEPHTLEAMLGRDPELPARLATGALDLAARLLMEYGRSDSVKVILAVTDGRDGYVLAADECHPIAEAACREKGVSSKELQACVRGELEARILAAQQRLFVAKSRRLLPMLRAGGIQLHAVVLPDAAPHEADRMATLSLKSGGTPRVCQSDDDVRPFAEAAVAELGSTLVVDLPRAVLRSNDGEALRVLVEAEGPDARGRRRRVATEPVAVVTGIPGKGPLRWIAKAERALEPKVGATAAKWIVRSLLLVIGLLLAFLLFKLSKKLVGLVLKSLPTK